MNVPLKLARSSNKEKQIWVIREKKTKAKGNIRKKPSLVQRKNENRKKKRRNNRCRASLAVFGQRVNPRKIVPHCAGVPLRIGVTPSTYLLAAPLPLALGFTVLAFLPRPTFFASALRAFE